MADGSQSWEVLNTKVEFQGRQIEQLAEDTAKQFVGFRDQTQQQLGALRSDVKDQFDKLASTLDSLGAKLEVNNRETVSNSRTNWFSLIGTGLSAIGVSTLILGGLATLRLTPIENDVKSGKEAQAAIVSALEKITVKLDNFETRAELTERNTRVDAALAEAKVARDSLAADKVSRVALDSLLRERDAQIARLQQDVAENKATNIAQAKELVDVRIAAARADATQMERQKVIDRLGTDIDKRATAEALAGVRLRLNDQRDRINLLSNRQQFIYEKNFVTPKPALPDIVPQGPSSGTQAGESK